MFGISDIISIVMSALAVLLILPLHELAHGLAAHKLGDPTAKSLGRLTLNPLKHLDPIGALCLIFFRFGWAKPIPVNTRNLKKPKRDMALVALAGPLMNLLLAFFSALLWLGLRLLIYSVGAAGTFYTNLLFVICDFIYIFHYLNLGIAVFNLIPVPPLDGSRILCAFLPYRAVMWILRNERTIYLILLGWLIGGNLISRAMLTVPAIAASPILSFVAEMLSLSNILGYLAGLLSDLMFSFWRLIPIFN